MNQFPPAPEYPIRIVPKFFKNLQVKLHYRFQCQRHRRQILPPVSLVMLILVAYLPQVSTTQGKMVAKFASGVVDTGGKFAAGVIDTGGQP